MTDFSIYSSEQGVTKSTWSRNLHVYCRGHWVSDGTRAGHVTNARPSGFRCDKGWQCYQHEATRFQMWQGLAMLPTRGHQISDATRAGNDTNTRYLGLRCNKAWPCYYHKTEVEVLYSVNPNVFYTDSAIRSFSLLMCGALRDQLRATRNESKIKEAVHL